jgi:hypothetical protein
MPPVATKRVLKPGSALRAFFDRLQEAEWRKHGWGVPDGLVQVVMGIVRKPWALPLTRTSM